jgi:hypothetical protein
MEGTSGLERLEEIFRGLPGVDRFRKLMAGDANAVIRGAIDAAHHAQRTEPWRYAHDEELRAALYAPPLGQVGLGASRPPGRATFS